MSNHLRLGSVVGDCVPKEAFVTDLPWWHGTQEPLILIAVTLLDHIIECKEDM